jgi:hypothetical protein
MGRPSIHGEPMTAAQRKARSRANALGEVAGLLEMIEREAGQWRRCIAAGRPGATDADIAAGFAELSLWASNARNALPGS